MPFSSEQLDQFADLLADTTQRLVPEFSKISDDQDMPDHLRATVAAALHAVSLQQQIVLELAAARHDCERGRQPKFGG